MSENFQDNNETPEVSFGITGSAGEYVIEFADGARPVAGYLVDALGGAEKLAEQSAAIKQVEYADFISAYNVMREKRNLNEIGRNFIGSHFSRIGGGF